jgi:hypothetical protein
MGSMPIPAKPTALIDLSGINFPSFSLTGHCLKVLSLWQSNCPFVEAFCIVRGIMWLIILILLSVYNTLWPVCVTQYRTNVPTYAYTRWQMGILYIASCTMHCLVHAWHSLYIHTHVWHAFASYKQLMGSNYTIAGYCVMVYSCNCTLWMVAAHRNTAISTF